MGAATRSPVSVPGPTGRRPWSTILLREWAAAKYPAARLMEQVRLGPTMAKLMGVVVSPALEAALRVNNWYADGLIALEHEVLCIEAKMKPIPGAVGQVLFYLQQLRATPDLQNLMTLDLVPVVLFAEDDAAVGNFARRLGCRVEVYTPAWIGDWLTQVQFRNRVTAAPGASTSAS